MNDSMNQRFLKYVVCFFCAAVFQASGVQLSFASKIGRFHDNGLSLKSNDETVNHNAGKDCLTSGCHGSGGWKRFSLGGTIYTDSEGTAARAGAHIEAVDVNGITVNLTSDQIGNFYTAQSMTAPFMISVSYRGRMIKMPGAAAGGGCNTDGCHVAGSAGRIYVNTEDLDLAGKVTGIDMENSVAGAVIGNAKVSLSRKGRIIYRTTTDSTGAFIMKEVKANEYTLKVARKGYKTYKQSYEMKQKDVSPLEITLSRK